MLNHWHSGTQIFNTASTSLYRRLHDLPFQTMEQKNTSKLWRNESDPHKCLHCTFEQCSNDTRWRPSSCWMTFLQRPSLFSGPKELSLSSFGPPSKRPFTLKGQGWHLEAEDGSSEDWDLFLKDQDHRRLPCAAQGAWSLAKTSSCSSSSANEFHWCNRAEEESQ